MGGEGSGSRLASPGFAAYRTTTTPGSRRSALTSKIPSLRLRNNCWVQSVKRPSVSAPCFGTAAPAEIRCWVVPCWLKKFQVGRFLIDLSLR